MLAAPAHADELAPVADAHETVCTVQVVSVRSAIATPGGGRPADGAWVPVTLPDAWHDRWPDLSGNVWYRIDWQRRCPPGEPPAPVALALESVTMAGEVFVNAAPIWRDAHLTEPLSRSWNMPRYWLLPDAILHDGINTVWIRATGYAQQPSGLGPVYLGDPATVMRIYDVRMWRNRTLTMVSLILSGVMAALFFLAWLASGRVHREYGWYAVTSLWWLCFLSNITATTPWPFTHTLPAARANLIAFSLYVACYCVFTWRFGKQHLPRIERVLWAMTAVMIALLAATPDAHLRGVMDVAFLGSVAVFNVNCLQFLVHALRTRERDYLMLGLCGLAYVVIGLHDVLFIHHLASDQPYLPLGAIVAALGMSLVLGVRMARDARRLGRFSVELTEAVTRARSELADTLERSHTLVLANTLLQERLQIAHELHDGFGGSLVQMMAMVEQATTPLDNDRVLSLLKLMRNDLRQTIDLGTSAGVRVPDTPTAWIAPLRHRFVRLFDELDVDTDWQFPSKWLKAPDAMQCLALTRLVEEALANVIKHSRARRVTLMMDAPEPQLLVLCIEDDGIGFDVDAVRSAGVSVGMRSMHARIARVGGTLHIFSQPGSTRLLAQLHLTEPGQTANLPDAVPRIVPAVR